MFILDLFEAQQKQTLVLIPGGFHPFHPGHLSLYRAAEQAFPGAHIVYVATDDRKDRPFPFAEKQKLAQIAGVNPKNFQLVKSPFVAKEVTGQYDPDNTVLIFARSEKDRNEPPGAGGVKKDGTPSYLQPYHKGNLAPMSQHGYMVYLPTVQFDAGPSGVTSATQIRTMWPQADDAQKNAIIADLYPRNPAVARQILDKYLGGGLAEGLLDKFVKPKMKFNIETAGEELYVDVTLGGKQVAGFTFDMLGHDLEAQDMSVTPEYRGQGIAQTVYDMLKAKGFRINRSQHQTDAGSHFWDKNKGAGSKVWEQGVAEGKIQYGVLDNDNVNLIIDKSVSKPDGIYSFRGILFRVKGGKVTHYAADGKILQAMGRVNTQIGSYDSSTQAKSILKSIKQGVAEGRVLHRDLKSWTDDAKSQGLNVIKPKNDLEWTHHATDKTGKVCGKFCTTNVPQNSRGFIHKQGLTESVVQSIDQELALIAGMKKAK